MKRFGLIGHPIAHSLSPALFKAAYEGRYPYDLIEEEDFQKAFDTFKDGYDAINVTAPFKELAFRKADNKSPECEIIGAANILIKTDEGITAANSDVMGVMGAITEGSGEGIRTEPTALVVGCGGAGKAAAYALCCAGYKTVILNRDMGKAISFAERLSSALSLEILVDRPENLGYWFKKSGVIVYTLPVAIPSLVSLKKQEIRGGIFRKKTKIILEANYKDPAFSDSLTERLTSINPNLKYIDGKEWLLYQAVGAYRSFTLEEANIEEMKNVIDNLRNNR